MPKRTIPIVGRVTSPWVALDSTSDRRALARRLARDRDSVLSGGSPAGRLREVIVGSWRRSRSAGVDADAGVAPVRVGADEAAARWAAHPLSSTLPEIRALLEDVREEARQVMLFCDRDGTLLWIEGEDAVLDAAQAVNLAPGAIWSEAAAGTNAMGTALAVGHPLQVFSAEHFSAQVHQWTCSAAPVRDPATGEVIGVLDLSGDLGTAHPHSLAVVSAAAKLAEASLRRSALEASSRSAERPFAAASARAALRVSLLGSERGRLDEGTGTRPLSRRHSEILALLALRPEGWTAEQLAIELLGEQAKPVSARAELSRLRRLVGDRVTAQPYRLTDEAEVDVLEVERRLEAGDLEGALARYGGELLPFSEVPTIIEVRHRLEAGLREAVLASGDPALLARWIELPSGREDEVACRRLIELLVPGDPRLATALSRLERLS